MAATKEKAVKDETKTEVAEVQAGLPAELLDEIAGGPLGYSEKSEDTLIPILSILQDNSGEVKKKHDRWIEGAEPGMLIVRSLQRLYSGDDGILFQPCGFDHQWVQWSGEPGEGAVVGNFPFAERPADAVLTPDPQNADREYYKMPDGTRLVDTRYHFGHVLEADAITPMVIPMAGTNHTASRQWTATMKQFNMPGRNIKAPAYMRCYRLTTRFTQRGAQSWYKYSVQDQGFIGDQEILRAGMSLAKMVAENKVTADVSTEGGTDAPAGDVPI